MILKSFDHRMALVAQLRKMSYDAEQMAQAIESLAIKDAGITHIQREAGFPSWQMKGDENYYNTPREALEHNQK